jgi:dihydroorotate dehydrogenase
MAIIGVGGIMTASDAVARLEAGADLVQLYSGFIYEGPALIESALKEISAAYSSSDKNSQRATNNG